MQYIMHFFDIINDLGAATMLPICMFVIGLIFRVKPGLALKSALRVGIGIFGLNMMINVAIENIQPLALALVETLGIHKPVVDGGVGVEILAAFTFRFASLMIPAGILLNVVLLLLRFTKTVDVDVWNFWPWLLSAEFLYLITGSYLIAWIGFFLTGAISLKLGDIQAPKMQQVYGLEGISFPHPCSTWYAWPAPFFNKLFDLIGLGKIKADPASVQKKLGVFGDTTIIGALVGFILALLGGNGLGTALTSAVSFGAITLLFPQVIGYLVEGLVPISNAARTMLQKKFQGREFYIGLDCAIGVGQPANVVANAICIPIFVCLALILPGTTVLPAAGIAVGCGFALASAMPYFNNNIVKGVLYCSIMMIPTLYLVSWAAPLMTEAYVLGGGVVEGGAEIACSTSGYIWSYVMAFFASLFGG